MNQEILNKIRALSLLEPRIDILRRLAKLMEESGELSEAILNVTGSNYKNKSIDDIKEESVDVLLIILSIIWHPDINISDEEFLTILETKFNKWQAFVNRNNGVS